MVLVFLFCCVFLFRLEANAPASIAEIVVEISLIAILETNVVEELIVVVGEWVVIVLAIVSIVEAANICGVLVIDGVARKYFAECFCVERREGQDCRACEDENAFHCRLQFKNFGTRETGMME